MGGVNRHDMLRQVYGVNCKCMKWWHRIFFGAFDVAIVNAFVFTVLYVKADTAAKISLLDFRRELAQGLLTLSLGQRRRSMGARKRRKTSYSVPASVRLSNVGVHWPQFVDTKARCEVCSNEGKESRPHSICSHCSVYLCCNKTKNCFVKYHS